MNDDLSILLTAQPRFLEDEDGRPPALPSFPVNQQQVNDPRRRLPILVTTDQNGSGKSGGGLSAQTIPFLAPSNGAFGVAQVYVNGGIQEL